MEIQTLKNNLLESYSPANLNLISVVLLNLYKNQQFGTLQKIAEIISDFVKIEIDENGKGFSKLMLLYHPDRGEFHRSEISKLAAVENFDALLNYSHILKLERIEEMASALESLEDIDYSPVYAWDFADDGFSVQSDSDKKNMNGKLSDRKNKPVTFYEAVKIRQYGHTKISFPAYYLEDIDEFEMASSDINDLDGIQYCIHAVNIDLSDNFIDDLRHLENLGLIEMLNLSDNRISDIDSLEYLTNLRELNLANNQIQNISPLFSLAYLEFVDLSGNPVQSGQIRRLRNKGITVES
ncbi:MAG: leucine-rich repeat domain-containing protein [Draconibacterium sp.]